MKKKSLIWIAVVFAFLAGCENLEILKTSDEYQQAEQLAISGAQVVKDKANDLTEQAKAEAKKQYESLKNDAKTAVKDSVNQKIDETFDRL